MSGRLFYQLQAQRMRCGLSVRLVFAAPTPAHNGLIGIDASVYGAVTGTPAEKSVAGGNAASVAQHK